MKVIKNGEPCQMSYEEICKALGDYIPEIHFVEVTPSGAISFTLGNPDEVKTLYRRVVDNGFKPAKKFVEAMQSLVGNNSINGIKGAREKACLTQQEAADLLGISKRTLQDWEDGRRIPKQGYGYWAERVSALGILTSEGQEQVLDGNWDMDYVLGLYKQDKTKELSEWGRYGDTYEANRRRIPESVWKKLPPEDLALLVDAIKAAYDAGVAHGQSGAGA